MVDTQKPATDAELAAIPVGSGQVAAHAVAVNPDVGIARAQAQDAKAQIDVSAAQYGPVVSFGAGWGRENT